jgi:hemoglobin-like flavoprotein
MQTLAQFLKEEYNITPMSAIYDISMDIHCDANHTDTYDGKLLKAISEVLGRELTKDEKEDWFEAKSDFENS